MQGLRCRGPLGRKQSVTAFELLENFLSTFRTRTTWSVRIATTFLIDLFFETDDRTENHMVRTITWSVTWSVTPPLHPLIRCITQSVTSPHSIHHLLHLITLSIRVGPTTCRINFAGDNRKVNLLVLNFTWSVRIGTTTFSAHLAADSWAQENKLVH